MAITGNCDNCVKPGGVQYRNFAEEAHLLMTAIKACGGKFGLVIPIDVLRGSMVRYLLFRNSVSKLVFEVFEELACSDLCWGSCNCCPCFKLHDADGHSSVFLSNPWNLLSL